MKIHLTNTIRDDLGIIELNTLDDLIKLYEEKKEPLIFSRYYKYGKKKEDPTLPDYEIEIYDGYRE